VYILHGSPFFRGYLEEAGMRPCLPLAIAIAFVLPSMMIMPKIIVVAPTCAPTVTIASSTWIPAALSSEPWLSLAIQTANTLWKKQVVI